MRRPALLLLFVLLSACGGEEETWRRIDVELTAAAAVAPRTFFVRWWAPSPGQELPVPDPGGVRPTERPMHFPRYLRLCLPKEDRQPRLLVLRAYDRDAGLVGSACLAEVRPVLPPEQRWIGVQLRPGDCGKARVVP